MLGYFLGVNNPIAKQTPIKYSYRSLGHNNNITVFY